MCFALRWRKYIRKYLQKKRTIMKIRHQFYNKTPESDSDMNHSNLSLWSVLKFVLQMSFVNESSALCNYRSFVTLYKKCFPLNKYSFLLIFGVKILWLCIQSWFSDKTVGTVRECLCSNFRWNLRAGSVVASFFIVVSTFMKLALLFALKLNRSHFVLFDLVINLWIKLEKHF